jgi:hypothetical protein
MELALVQIFLLVFNQLYMFSNFLSYTIIYYEKTR